MTTTRLTTDIDEIELKARTHGILNRWPAVGLAVGVVRDGRLERFHGHGLADIASATPITEDTAFRIGSVTKTFTAIAVLQALGAGAGRPRRAGQRLPARLPADPREGELRARHGAPAPDPHGRGP